VIGSTVRGEPSPDGGNTGSRARIEELEELRRSVSCPPSPRGSGNLPVALLLSSFLESVAELVLSASKDLHWLLLLDRQANTLQNVTCSSDRSASSSDSFPLPSGQDGARSWPPLPEPRVPSKDSLRVAEIVSTQDHAGRAEPSNRLLDLGGKRGHAEGPGDRLAPGSDRDLGGGG